MSVNAVANGTPAPADPGSARVPWTCPFCPLMCDQFSVTGAGRAGPLKLSGGACPRAARALASFDGLPPTDGPWLDGEDCSLDAALQAAAERLLASRQPLFGGLGTDVAGARELYRLAALTGAISDARAGAAVTQTLRVLQDRGSYTTTLAEVHERGGLIVVFGPSPGDDCAHVWERFGLGDADGPKRHVVLVGSEPDPWLAKWQGGRVETVGLQGDLLDTLGVLVALAEGRPLPAADEALVELVAALQASPYSVLTWDSTRLPLHNALHAEALHRLVAALNRKTRAGAFVFGPGEGAMTVNQTYTWLSGLPLRSRAGPRGLEHEPLLYDATALLAEGAVDALLWVAAFSRDALPPVTSLPRIVLGPPGMEPGPGPGVFIPVSTPGIGSAGHLFRTDGVVLLPLTAARPDTLPTVAQVIRGIADRVVAARAAAPEGVGA